MLWYLEKNYGFADILHLINYFLIIIFAFCQLILVLVLIYDIVIYMNKVLLKLIKSEYN